MDNCQSASLEVCLNGRARIRLTALGSQAESRRHPLLVSKAAKPAAHRLNRRLPTAPVSHRKRPYQDATNGIEPKRKCSKINEADLYPLLMTVWLQVRVLPGPPTLAGTALPRTLEFQRIAGYWRWTERRASDRNRSDRGRQLRRLSARGSNDSGTRIWHRNRGGRFRCCRVLQRIHAHRQRRKLSGDSLQIGLLGRGALRQCVERCRAFLLRRLNILLRRLNILQ